VGAVLNKNGVLSSQKKPYIQVDPPFEKDNVFEHEGVKHWPVLVKRIACNRRHDGNPGTVDSRTKPGTPKRLGCVNKGQSQGCDLNITLWSIGTKCPFCLYCFSDGSRVYFCVDHKSKKAFTKEESKSTAAEIVTYLQTGHNHDLIPDVSLIKADAIARGVPPLAVHEVLSMRGTGMAIKDIHKAIEVYEHFDC
jgi:hypothetical protein